MEEMLTRIYVLVAAVLVVLVFVTIPLAVYSVLCYVRDRKDAGEVGKRQGTIENLCKTQKRLTDTMAECHRCSTAL